MGAVSTYFGLGTFAGFLVFNTAGVYLMGIVDRLSGLSAALRFSILPVVLLSVLAAGVFSLGVRHNRESVEWRAMLLGLALTAGYWALVAIASALLLSFSIELPTALAFIPFLVICGFTSRLTR